MPALAADPLGSALAARSEGDSAYWSFPSIGRRRGAHAFFSYPAMMVPEVQGALLDTALTTDAIRSVYDPFLGAGTMVVESLVRGLDLYGTDLNPLAVLLSEVKANPPSVQDLDAFIAAPHRADPLMDLSSPTIEKWFKPTVALALSEIREWIRAENSLEVRRFLWVCLAETVRLVSNSRTSTFKLHVYAQADLERRVRDAIVVFSTVLKANRERLAAYRLELLSAKLEAKAVVVLSSVQDDESKRTYDLLMTSPPYGDNKTTVPYGQYSYLPLLFIDFEDIPGRPSSLAVKSTLQIDSSSLGGSLAGADERQARLLERAPSLLRTIVELDDRPALRRKVVAFMSDYDDAVSAAVKRVKPGGLCMWTLGERRVGGHVIPLVAVTNEILALSGQSEVCTIERAFPANAKRMAHRNNVGKTMSGERILVTRVPK